VRSTAPPTFAFFPPPPQGDFLQILDSLTYTPLLPLAVTSVYHSTALTLTGLDRIPLYNILLELLG